MCVNSEKEEHHEKADIPELGKRHHSCSLRVSDEGQTWTCKEGREYEQEVSLGPPKTVQLNKFLPESTTVSTVTL